MIDKIAQLIQQDPRGIYKLSKESGLSYALLYRIVNGEVKRTIWLDTAFKIADVLGIDVNEFRDTEIAE